MNKILFAVIFSVIFIFTAAPALAREKIDSFLTDIKMNSDASINVQEKIVYDFGTEERHGIYRNITVSYKARGGNYNLRVSDISVVDENENPYNFTTSYPGDYLEIKIGDADKLISGVHTYIIRYTVNRAINFFDDHDELYWNSTGNEWQVPIIQARTTVTLPTGLPEGDVQYTCYFGAYGSTKVCDSSAMLPAAANRPITTLFFDAADLEAGEGLTVVVGVPVGTIQKPPITQTVWEIIRDNGILLLPIIVFFWLFRKWRRNGKDEKGRGTIIPEYEAPDKMTPAEVGTLYDNRANRHDVSAEIIFLATKGYLKIRREETGSVFKSTDYVFTKLKPSDELKNEIDIDIMKGLFESGDEVKLSDLKYKFAPVMQKTVRKLYEKLTADGYFKKNPMTVKALYLTGGFLLFFFSFFLGAFFGFFGLLAFIFSAILFCVFAFIMPALTKKGAEAREKVLGLKLYMTVAEKARIEFHNAPEKNPEQFEKLLPYAMVMKVEKEWAGQFEGIYNTKPSWYDDPKHTGMFNAAFLAGSLSSFDTSAASTLAATVSSSASSGGSGFSGGGSGGGFGGGGGGSW